MKIILCGSIAAGKEILEIQSQLEKMGHKVEIPTSLKNEFLRQHTDISNEEKARDKIQFDLIRAYYEKIKKYDVVLIVNVDKKGIKNYIGGNTFLEMAFAHVLNKKLYCLNPLPETSYSSELQAMQPIILRGHLASLI